MLVEEGPGMEVEVISESVMASTPFVACVSAILDVGEGVQWRVEGQCLVARRLM